MRYTPVKEILQNLVERQFIAGEDNYAMVDYISTFFSGAPFKVIKFVNPKYPHSQSLVIQTDFPDKPLVLFSGHLDVVSAYSDQTDHTAVWCYSYKPPLDNRPEKWNFSSNNLTESDNKFYARGTADMLGGVASVLSAISKNNFNNVQRNIAIILSDDEEKDFISVKRMLNDMLPIWQQKQQIPEGCIICEPSEMVPIIGHRSAKILQLQVIGKSSHITRGDLGVDAFDYANKMYSHLSKMCVKEKQNIEDDNRFIPSNLTFNTFKFESEQHPKKNIHAATLGLYLSAIPQYPIDSLIMKMQSYVKLVDKQLKHYDSRCGAVMELTADYPGFIYDKDNIFTQKIIENFNEQELRGSSFGTEAAAFVSHNIPTIVIGPGCMLQAHAPDEYVETNQLIKAVSFYDNYISSEIINSRANNFENTKILKQKLEKGGK